MLWKRDLCTLYSLTWILTNAALDHVEQIHNPKEVEYLSVILCLLLTSKIREENCFSMLHSLLLKVYKSYEAIRCFLFLVSVTTFKLVIMHHLHVKTESHVFFKWTIRVLWCHAESLKTKFMKKAYIGYLKYVFS